MSDEILIIGSIEIKKIYEDGEFLHLEFKDLEDPDCTWIEWPDGTKEWLLNGQLHREGGPACEFSNGTKKWFLNGKRHREGGPAIELASGDKFWYLNGNYHREDGPAVEYADGTKRWLLNGKYLTEKEHRQQTQSCIDKVVEIDGKKYKLV